ncbi:uncharacterized protein B0I36DRAFT_337111 [Microdochium trichocladiopsis]|uniref:Uncharacterized protein n=1 Tax=Microdochium trichocladiopsis TaxID=1682393 RepID=A0A9P8XV63_9PEZI|nr:uncharacterized protein B0I36DRAFT_337111 [Microdochium trichocladiopsis]KAH7016242.1 hypothetical protein B0I36DRAFT_337111 [Microdochium trichocladiopsis]
MSDSATSSAWSLINKEDRLLPTTRWVRPSGVSQDGEDPTMVADPQKALYGLGESLLLWYRGISSSRTLDLHQRTMTSSRRLDVFVGQIRGVVIDDFAMFHVYFAKREVVVVKWRRKQQMLSRPSPLVHCCTCFAVPPTVWPRVCLPFHNWTNKPTRTLGNFPARCIDNTSS